MSDIILKYLTYSMVQNTFVMV